jgi:hypothetical protein
MRMRHICEEVVREMSSARDGVRTAGYDTIEVIQKHAIRLKEGITQC